MTKTLSVPKLFRRAGYHPHQGQRQIHQDETRHRVGDCGRRFGKSTLGGYELLIEAVKAHQMKEWLRQNGKQKWFWIVGPNYEDAEREFRVVYRACERLEFPFDRPGTYYTPGLQSAHQVSLWDGAFILECKTADKPDSLDGEGLDGVIMAEAAKMKRSIWDKYIRPALSDKRGWSIWNSTPEGKNHFYEKWQRGNDPDFPQWASWKMPSWINDHVFPGGRQDPEILEMEHGLSTERFKQEVAAEFTEFVGAVFKDWDEQIHVRDLEYDPSLPLYGAVDYGFRNPFVWLAIQVDTWDNVYVIGEYYKREKDIGEIGQYLKTWDLARNARSFFPDPSEPGDTRALERRLKVPEARKYSVAGEIRHRLELIRRWLKPQPDHLEDGHPEKQPKLFVDRSCINLIFEMEEYRYPEDKREEEEAAEDRVTGGESLRENPIKENDHGPEALGRFFKGYYGGPGDEERTPPRQSSARVTSGAR